MEPLTFDNYKLLHIEYLKNYDKTKRAINFTKIMLKSDDIISITKHLCDNKNIDGLIYLFKKYFSDIVHYTKKCYRKRNYIAYLSTILNICDKKLLDMFFNHKNIIKKFNNETSFRIISTYLIIAHMEINDYFYINDDCVPIPLEKDIYDNTKSELKKYEYITPLKYEGYYKQKEPIYTKYNYKKKLIHDDNDLVLLSLQLKNEKILKLVSYYELYVTSYSPYSDVFFDVLDPFYVDETIYILRKYGHQLDLFKKEYARYKRKQIIYFLKDYGFKTDHMMIFYYQTHSSWNKIFIDYDDDKIMYNSVIESVLEDCIVYDLIKLCISYVTIYEVAV